MTADEIMKMMEKAKELGVYELEYDGMKLTFTPKKKIHGAKPLASQVAQKVESQKVPSTDANHSDSKELVQPINLLEGISDEELLYLASPYYHELQTKKALHQAVIDEEKAKKD